jgi:hypothetical protein
METLPPLFKMRNILGVVYDSPLVARILFDTGEIELRANEKQLTIFSKCYSTPCDIRTPIVKDLASGYSPEVALCNAGNSIINRVFEINRNVQEVNRRNELSLYRGVNEYLNRYFSGNNGSKKKANSSIEMVVEGEKVKVAV